jgi:penicillin-binding protein activator
MSGLRRSLVLSIVLVAGAAAAACAEPHAVRGSEVPGLNSEALSTGLDQRDLQTLLHKNMEALQRSAVIQRWQNENNPTVAVLPFRNDTTEHIGSQLDALISDVETVLVNAGHVRVVSVERQPQLMAEIRRQYSGAFDPAQMARWGKQVGAHYFVTGKVFSNDERTEDERRVQYFMFMQVLDVETGDILFQNKTSLTKAIVD